MTLLGTVHLRGTRGQLESEIVHDAFGGHTGEAHREHNQVGLDDFCRVRDFVRLERFAERGHFPVDFDDFHTSNVTVFHEELLGRYVPAALTTFVLGIARTQDVRPVGPRRRRRTGLGRRSRK